MRRSCLVVTFRHCAISALTTLAGFLLAADLSMAGVQYRMAFVTSATGTADLDTWAEADGTVSGVDAGDSICRNLATSAGLDNPANFVAWLSTDSVDAYCRVHGLGGTKSTNCGELALPESAGPWVRTDGFAWAPAIEVLTSDEPLVYTPLSFDENGQPIVTQPRIFTATHYDGRRASNHTTCSDWTESSTEFAVIGVPQRTVWGWTIGSSSRCNVESRITCLETVGGPPLPENPAPTRPAFVTSVRGTGDLSSWPNVDSGAAGLDAGDSICRNLASAGGLEGAALYKAWLSDSVTNAIDRFQHDGPWQRLDGIQFASDKADLTDGVLFTTISWTEQNGVLGNSGAFTGTNSDGTLNVNNCQDWSSASDIDAGQRGGTNASLAQWTQSGEFGCNVSAGHLYCLVDLPFPIFDDGFESGNTSTWSDSVP